MSDKWCRIEVDCEQYYAMVEGEEALMLNGPPFAGGKPNGKHIKLKYAKLLPPVQPRNFYAAGLNYPKHIQWANEHHKLSLKVPTQADIGYRSPNALIGSGGDVILPLDSTGSFEFEGELVAVIGREAKHLTDENALKCIAGYTLGNDLSERAWQFSDRTLWRAKSSDTFKPMGPFVVSDIDPMAQDICVRINGKTVSIYNTSAMIFGVVEHLVRMSRYMTLYPGDVIWFGCDGATVPGLKPGDFVEVMNEAIGTLANKIVRAL